MPVIEFINALDFWAITRLIIFQLFVFFFLYRVTKTRQPGPIDPFTIALFFCASGWSIVLELYINDLCATHLMITFLAANISFLIGYLLIAPKIDKIRPAPRLVKDKRLAWYGLIVLVIYLAIAILNITLFGFGISHENRLDIYTESNGFGLLKRFLDAFMPGTVFYLVYQINFRKGFIKALAIMVLGFISINTILDGSKSGLVTIFLAFSMSMHWLRMSNLLPTNYVPRRVWLWALLSMIIAIAVLGIQIGVADDLSRAIDTLYILFFRVLVAGDIFILGFPYNKIDNLLPNQNPIIVLFSDFLSTTRLWSGVITPLGTELVRSVNPDISIISGGPNSHLSIYGYYLFGPFGGTLFAFMAGILFGTVRAGFAKSIGNDLVAGSLMITLLLNTANVLIDPSYTLHRITNIMLLVPILLCFLKIKTSSTGTTDPNTLTNHTKYISHEAKHQSKSISF